MWLHQKVIALNQDLSLDSIGQEALKALKWTIVDTIGVMAASSRQPIATEISAMAEAWTGCSNIGEKFAVIGSNNVNSMAAAALANGALGHAFDFDDVHLPSLAHFSTTVIPAALAVCQSVNAPGRSFLESVLSGDEIGGRIGSMFCSPKWAGSAIRQHGFFPTSILGTIAAAAGAARALKLSPPHAAHALALACSHAGGLASVSRGDNSSKRLQAGWASQAGLAAALFARQGVTGPEAVLETRQGFIDAFSGGLVHPERIAKIANDPYICEEMSFKYYPIEYIIHPLVELAVDARQTVSHRLSDVVRIEASATSHLRTLFEPLQLKQSPPDGYAALISAPYCISRALQKEENGHLTMADFTSDFTMNAKTKELTAKIVFEPDRRFDSAFPLDIGGRLIFHGSDGVIWQGEKEAVYGSPRRPMSEAHLLEKFLANTGFWSSGKQEEVYQKIMNLENEPDSTWAVSLNGDFR